MIIIINHKEAVLKKGTSFDFVAENYMFTGADNYTLSITLPIKGCAQNIEIFGYMYRKDFDFSETLLDCEIHERNVHKYGVVSIVELDEEAVKVQFLEGRSKRNFYSTFDDIYINDIEMPSVQITPGNLTPVDLMKSYDQQKAGTYYGYVVLPWVNNTSGNMQNDMEWISAQELKWKDATTAKVGFPYLLDIMQRVFTGAGFSYDFSELENSQWKDCIICNALPEPWELPARNLVLPHWTITEFIEELEKLMDGYMEVDDVAMTVKFRLNESILDEQETVILEDVVDTLSVDINDDSEDAESNYVEQKGYAYQDGGHQMMKYYSCPWVLDQVGVTVWNTYSAMYNAVSPYLIHDFTHEEKYNHPYYKKIHYCKDIDSYFILKYDKWESHEVDGVWHYYERLYLLQINQFAPYVGDGESEEDCETINIVPVCIDRTDEEHGEVAFLECGTYGEDSSSYEKHETIVVNTIKAGEQEKKAEYYNMIYIGFWDGEYRHWGPDMPKPIIDKVEPAALLPLLFPYTLRLKRDGVSRHTVRYKLDQSRKYTFKFLSDTIPNATSVFMIHGKKYLAEKITATFSADTGMSQQMKMEAYRIEDD